MSLLMKALKKVERGPHGEGGDGAAGWSLAPMEQRADQAAGDQATPRAAQAAADLIRAREDAGEGRRLAILLGVLVLVVVGMGGYFYVAVYMPWLLLPRPTQAVAPVPVAASVPVPQPSPAARPALETLPAPELAPPRRPAARVDAPAESLGPAASAPARAPAAAPARGERLTVRSERGASGVAPAAADGVVAAYDLLQAGQYEQARQAYEKLRMAQPDNPDVLLGLAVIAQNENHSERAAQLYLRVIELDPRNSYAQAGLVSLIGRAEPAAAEAKLRQLIAQQPAAYLQFALGNLYAAQGRWSEAQAAYFEAQRLEPDAADNAFNLAVSLEHLGQPRAAAEYYQRALRLAQGGGAIHFDPAQARSRLQKLSR